MVIFLLPPSPRLSLPAFLLKVAFAPQRTLLFSFFEGRNPREATAVHEARFASVTPRAQVMS